MGLRLCYQESARNLTPCVVVHSATVSSPRCADTRAGKSSTDKGLLVEKNYRDQIRALVDAAPPLSRRQIAEAKLIVYAPADFETGETGCGTASAPYWDGCDVEEHPDEGSLAV